MQRLYDVAQLFQAVAGRDWDWSMNGLSEELPKKLPQPLSALFTTIIVL
jgi:hypothetical protein